MIMRITKSVAIALKTAIYAFKKSFREDETLDSILGYTDDLTHIPNRRAFQRDMASFDKSHSIIIIDIDDFKSINNTKGHLFGDIILRRLAEMLRKAVGESGAAYRFGGDEFAVVAPSVQAAKICADIRSRLSKEDSFTVSQGVVAGFEPSMLHDFMDLADKAMYSSKVERKEKIAFFSIAGPPSLERKRPRFYVRFMPAGAAWGFPHKRQAHSKTDLNPA